MKIVLKANETILKILEKFRKPVLSARMMRYCLTTHIDEGVLVFNVLTKEMVLLTEEEFSHFTDFQYLKDRWFVVSEDANEKEYASFLKWFASSQRGNLNPITAYTIFPTTDCNARCFYCFEHGIKKINMSRETAIKVVQYIKKHSCGKDVYLHWFGGEPLLNHELIDLICTELSKEGIKYKSQMTSNGYLLDDEVVQKAVALWNLKKIQITLDGTEKVYNRIKAYVYQEGNPYQTVLKNIERLLDASVKVTIRLNLGMDMDNADDLFALSEELGQRFGGRENLKVYVYNIYKNHEPRAELHSEAEWKLREETVCQIEDNLLENGLLHIPKLSRVIKKNHCMADQGNSILILPDGNIGLCETYSKAEYIGHIDSEGFDANIVASWRETVSEIPECAECAIYPDCVKIKRCGLSRICFPYDRRESIKKTKRAMLFEYKKWLENNEKENYCDEDDEPILM